LTIHGLEETQNIQNEKIAQLEALNNGMISSMEDLAPSIIYN